MAKCLKCNGEFIKQFPNQRYCSDTCSVMALREQKAKWIRERREGSKEAIQQEFIYNDIPPSAVAKEIAKFKQKVISAIAIEILKRTPAFAEEVFNEGVKYASAIAELHGVEIPPDAIEEAHNNLSNIIQGKLSTKNVESLEKTQMDTQTFYKLSTNTDNLTKGSDKKESENKNFKLSTENVENLAETLSSSQTFYKLSTLNSEEEIYCSSCGKKIDGKYFEVQQGDEIRFKCEDCIVKERKKERSKERKERNRISDNNNTIINSNNNNSSDRLIVRYTEIEGDNKIEEIDKEGDSKREEKEEKEEKKGREGKGLLKINFDFENRKWVGIKNLDVIEWQKAYPACDVGVELRRMKEWLLANPNKRKVNYRRFIVNWLSRCQDNGGTRGLERYAMVEYNIGDAGRDDDDEED